MAMANLALERLLSANIFLLSIGTGLGVLTIYAVLHSVYNIWFHPLSKFPGPKLAATTPLPLVLSIVLGRSVYYIQGLHRNYGDIVRTAPNTLSFAHENAWKNIYGHRQGHESFKKSPPVTPANGVPNLVTTTSDADHSRMRHLVSHAFSDKALRDQESLLQSYVNMLIQKLRQQSGPCDMTRWLSFTTFDIIADLSFGESFGCLQSSEYHPWVKASSEGAQLGVIIHQATEFPWLCPLLKRMIPNSMIQRRMQHSITSRDKLTRRLKQGAGGRADFVSYILRYDHENGMNRDEMDSNMSLFFTAGSETTASLLSGMIYYLLKHPLIMDTLTQEVRGTFTNEADITIASAEKLPYLNAVLKETLRLYPPAPMMFNRLVPESGDEVCGHWIPGGTRVGVANYVINRNPTLFFQPDSYIPERWLGNDARFTSDKLSSVQPFSHGPRNCIGKNLANAEMRIIAARLLWNFDMELCPESNDWIKDMKAYLIWDKPPLIVSLSAKKAA